MKHLQIHGIDPQGKTYILHRLEHENNAAVQGGAGAQDRLKTTAAKLLLGFRSAYPDDTIKLVEVDPRKAAP